MGIISSAKAWIRSVTVKTVRYVHARYDAARTTDDNARHWLLADNLSANAANSAHVRRILRSRSRYEIANNTYARGIVNTLANFAIGTGPRLQMLLENPEANRTIERLFQAWAKEVGLAEKLRTMRMARAGDGESFAIFTYNPKLPCAVKLDIRLIEADQVASPLTELRVGVDGIDFDEYGNPKTYWLLDSHPGDLMHYSTAANPVAAASVLHWFKADRPGQARGIPEITPALPLFAQLRRYTLAVLSAAEWAASVNGVVKTDSPYDPNDPDAQAWQRIEFERNALMTMPGGMDVGQLKAEQPTGTYAEFKNQIINEIARCLEVPFNVAAGNSAGYNYASGRLDFQMFFKSIRVEQSQLASVVLDRILSAWLDEALLIPGYLPPGITPIDSGSHTWFFDGNEHVDPQKEANAQATRLLNHTTTLATEYARQGVDWESALRQRAKELSLMSELGLAVAAPSTDKPVVQEETDDELVDVS